MHRDLGTVTLVVRTRMEMEIRISIRKLLHLLRFFEEKSMTHMFTSSALNVLKLNVTYRIL